jgi:hypothetical protein
MIYIPCHFSHVIPYMSSHIIPCHISCHLHHGISIITNMLYIPCRISHVKPYISCSVSRARSHMPSDMPSPSWHIHHYQHSIYTPCHVSHAKSYMSCHIIPCHISHTSCHPIFIVAYPSLPTYYIFHAIYPMSYNILWHALLSHAIYHMPYGMPYTSWHIHHYQHDTYSMPCLPCQTKSGMPYYPMPYLTCHLAYHRPHGIVIITKMIYIP